MTLRYYAAITTGALATVAATTLLWGFTKLEAQEIAFIATFAFWGAAEAVMIATEGRDRHDRSKRAASRRRRKSA